MKKRKSLTKTIFSVIILGFVFVTLATLFPNDKKVPTKTIDVETISVITKEETKNILLIKKP